MTNTQFSLPSGKAEFNFEEAAALLGISASELAELVVEQFDPTGAAQRNLARLRFRPADLIMLNFSRVQTGPAPPLD